MTMVGEQTMQVGDIDPEVFSAAKKAEVVAWDIETTNLDWRTERIGTVQLSIPEFGNVIVQIRDGVIPANLVTLLNTTRVKKVFHYAPFDLRFMVHLWSARPSNVACTKVLSKILFPVAEDHSLKGLLQAVLGVEIEKTAARTSDWSAHSLSRAQIEYAIGDVAHLVDLYDALMDRAVVEGVANIVESSFDYLPHRVQTDLRGCGDIFDY